LVLEPERVGSATPDETQAAEDTEPGGFVALGGLVIEVEDVFESSVDLETVVDFVAAEKAGDRVVVENDAGGIEAVVRSGDFGAEFPAVAAEDETSGESEFGTPGERVAGVAAEAAEILPFGDDGVEPGGIGVEADSLGGGDDGLELEPGGLGVDDGGIDEGERIDIDEVVDIGLEIGEGDGTTLVEDLLPEAELAGEAFFGE
jgi:hypothetical protein